MRMTPEHISELLTHRDGERLDPRRSSEIEADPEMRSQLATLRQLKHDLNELPDVTPPPDTWAQIQARTSARPSTFAVITGRFPLAMAATVALAAMIGIVVWDPANLQSQGPASAPQVADLSSVAAGSTGSRYAALVNRSQQLESALLFQPGAGVDWNTDQRALLYRIADLDTQLNAEPSDELASLEAREQLWAQRVRLLESLAQSRRATAQAVVF